MKASSKFQIKMSIQSLFDLRKTLEIITDLFQGSSKLSQYFFNGSLHNILKQYHQFTSTFSTTSDEDLALPHSRLYHHPKALSEEEEKSLQAFDYSEFLYPYKKVKGTYGYLNAIKDKQTLNQLLEMIMMFLSSSQRPHHIEEVISRNVHAFGKEGVFQGDLEILENWCQSIMKIHENVEAVYKISEEKARKELEQVVG